MAPIGKLTWCVLLAAWVSSVGITVAVDSTPDEEPELVRVSDKGGPEITPSLVAMPHEDVQWPSR
jgi:hypothetical protein